MSESILLAGKRGTGKSLAATWMAGKYLAAGRPVATNLNLFVDRLAPAYCRTRWYRLPDFPRAQDLLELPMGNPVPQDEGRNGLLILDEAGTFLNSREWQGGGRQDVISWLLQSRKYGWDLLLIAQHANLLDKQIRESLVETQGTLRRLDKIKVPLLSGLYKYFTGNPLHFPRMHFAALRYGFGIGAPVSDNLFFRGEELYGGYDTLQKISPVTGQQGTSWMLSAWELKGQYMKKWDLRRQMAAGGLVIGCLIGLPGGYLAAKLQPKVEAVKETVSEVKVRGVVHDEAGREFILLADGSTGLVAATKADLGGVRYLVGSIWYAKQ